MHCITSTIVASSEHKASLVCVFTLLIIILLGEYPYKVGLFINPRRACAARVTVLGLCVCLCVCVSAPLYSRTSRNYAANKKYERLQRHLGSKNKKAFCLRKLERYLLTIRIGHFVARALSCLYACVCIVYVCHAQEHVSGVGTVAGFFCVFLE